MAIYSFPVTISMAAAIRRGCRITRPTRKLWIGHPGAWLRFKPRGAELCAIMRGRRGEYEASALGAAYIGTYCAGNLRAVGATAGLLRRGLLDIHRLLRGRYPILDRRILACGRIIRLIDLLARLDEQSFLTREQLANYVDQVECLAEEYPRGRIQSPLEFERELENVFASSARKNLALAGSALTAL